MSQNNELIWLDKASAAIQRVVTIGEAKTIADKAASIKLFAAKQGWSKREVRRVSEIEVRATARLGELLDGTPKAKGRSGPGRGKAGSRAGPAFSDTPTLSDLGVTKKLSHVAQRVATVKPKARERYFAECADNDKQPTVTGLNRLAKENERENKRDDDRKRVATTTDLSNLTGVFATIAIDPPWDFADEGDVDQFGRGRPDYATMTIDEIAALPVGKKAADDCHLYLWITNRSLPKGFALLDAWGFRYITCLTWCKPSIGMGNYFRGSTEQILFAVKGSLPLKRKDVGTWFNAPRPRKQHSAKPPEFYTLAESCSPGPYLDAFGRADRKGWTKWPE